MEWTRRQGSHICERPPSPLGCIIRLMEGICSYTMDPYGTLAKTDYSASGLGVYVSLSTMDRYWRPDLTREEALDVMRRCVKEVQHRE